MSNSYTKSFKPATDYIVRENLLTSLKWPLALDIGYSSVKGMSPNSVYCFPSFARELGDSKFVGSVYKSDIFYKDANGNEWIVGAAAQAMVNRDDTLDSTNTLYSRKRYYKPMFLVLARVGMALGMTSNSAGSPKGHDIIFQTGLPPNYLDDDAPLLIEALEGRHVFSVKLGLSDWEDYDITLDRDNIGIIEQPMGAVVSASKTNDGTTITGVTGRPIVEDNILVFDGGFGTLDTISIGNRRHDKSSVNTFDDLGMKAVYKLLREQLRLKYGINIVIHAIPQILETGYAIKRNRKTMTDEKIKIRELLAACNEAVCNQAIERINAEYDDLIKYDHLLLSGGTSAAWEDIIRDKYKNVSINVVSANQHDDIDPIYSNVRGYYLYSALSSAS
jgi:plasmid segregation protein ParM